MNAKLVIYTDGSSKGNPGPGGFGAVVLNEKKIVEIGGREEKTTNNRMEMMAAIESLKSVPENSEIEIYADSEYLINGITVWIKNWQKNNWRTKNKKPVLNKDLWEKLFDLTQNKKIKWQKVLGHSGHKLNDRCDEIATSFADGKNVDLYEGSRKDYKFHK